MPKKGDSGKDWTVYFNFRTFFHAALLCVFKWKDTPSPMTAKRVLFLIGFFTVFPLVQFFNTVCFLLDDILFPGWRKIQLAKPVFIIGNPRSGTTFIHRVMAKDEGQFFCFRTWEILFPAIIQKKILSLIGRIDRRIDGTFSNSVKRFEHRFFNKFNKIHRLGLFLPEEDDKLTIHIFSSFDLIWFFPFEELIHRFSHFDQLVEPKERKRIMTFYKNCIKRQAYYKGNKGHLLSKNPVCPPKIDSVYEYFPGCKIVYLVRNPLEVIPSTISLTHEIWRSTVNVRSGYPFKNQVYKTLEFFYDHALSRLEEAPGDSYVLVKYEELIRQPRQVLQKVYRKFGFEIDPKFIEILREEEIKAQNYKSGHVYSLRQFNLTPEKIFSDFHNVYEKFAYSIREENRNNAVSESRDSV
jgi:hypothetical protein